MFGKWNKIKQYNIVEADGVRGENMCSLNRMKQLGRLGIMLVVRIFPL